MKDGTELATTIWRPTTGQPVPVPNLFAMLRSGYAIALQDCRGTFASSGVFVPHVDEAADGAATIDWLAAQEWCNGSVGMWDAS